MKTEGKIERLDKESNWVVDTPSGHSKHVTNRYNYFLILNGQRYFYSDAKLTEHTKAGDNFVLIANENNEILAWKNRTKNVRSSFSILHLLFHSTNIVAAGTFAFFWYVVRNNPDQLNKLMMFGLPALAAIVIFTIVKSSKRMKAQNEIGGA